MGRAKATVAVMALLIPILFIAYEIGHPGSPPPRTAKPKRPESPPQVLLAESGGTTVTQAGLPVYEAELGPNSSPKSPPRWSDHTPAPVPIRGEVLQILIMSESPPDHTLVALLAPSQEQTDSWEECVPDPDDTAWVSEIGVPDADCLIGRNPKVGAWFVDLQPPQGSGVAKIAFSAIWHPVRGPGSEGNASATSLTASWVFSVVRE